MPAPHGLLVRWIVPLLGIGAALALLFSLYRDLDLVRFSDALRNSNTVWLAVLCSTVLLEQLIRGWKWRQILFDLRPVSALRLFGAVLAGYGAAVLVPLGISPFVRSWLVARLEGLRMASVLVTTAIERFLDGIVFALFAGFVAIAGRIPKIEGDVRVGLTVAGVLNLVLFAALLFAVFRWRDPLHQDDARLSVWIDWLADKGGRHLVGMRAALRDGIVWPRERWRQLGAIVASFAMKLVAATHFLWAGLAVGVLLAPLDYLFLMVFAGFALVLARFVRIPGGFVIGSGLALKMLDVPDEQALAMILFNHVLSIVLIVGCGLAYFWRCGLDIRAARTAG